LEWREGSRNCFDHWGMLPSKQSWTFPFQKSSSSKPVKCFTVSILSPYSLNRRLSWYKKQPLKMQIIFYMDQIISVIYTMNQIYFPTTTYNRLPWRNEFWFRMTKRGGNTNLKFRKWRTTGFSREGGKKIKEF
jgi:hypothetical protein